MVKIIPKTSFVDSLTNQSYQYNNEYEVEDKKAEELENKGLVRILKEEKSKKTPTKRRTVKSK